jgi:hypothetical protein
MGWKQIASEMEGRKMSSDMTNADKPAHADINMSSISPGSLLFSREVGSSLLPENLYSFEQLISNIFR